MSKTIIVLADDLTGAAEMAGIALQKGYTVSVCTTVPSALLTEVTVIAANTRSLSTQAAQQRTIAMALALQKFYPFYFFKKIDSVLRGHIETEINAWLTIFSYKKTFIIPANPRLGRIIKDGQYWIHQQPIHHTSFANDPEFPWHNANVLTRFSQTKVELLLPHQPLPSKGFFMTEIYDNQDIYRWVNTLGNDTLLVGAAAAFEAMLDKIEEKKYNDIRHTLPVDTGKKLYISGTSFSNSVKAIAQMAHKGHAVSYMPTKELGNNSDKIVILQNWVAEISTYLTNASTVVVAIHPDTRGEAPLLASLMATAIKQVLSQYRIDEILIEGGATAAALMEAMQWQYFNPTHTFAQGVIRMQCENTPTYLTLKPGSYDWPTAVWAFPTHNN